MRALLLCLILAAVTLAQAAKPNPGDIQTLAEMNRRLEKLILPSVQYRESTVEEIVADLNKIAKDRDPDKLGIPFELAPSVKNDPSARITLTLRNVPMVEVLKYITNLANLRYKVTATKVVISPLEK